MCMRFDSYKYTSKLNNYNAILFLRQNECCGLGAANNLYKLIKHNP